MSRRYQVGCLYRERRESDRTFGSSAIATESATGKSESEPWRTIQAVRLQ
jgi:hypothetical protein